MSSITSAPLAPIKFGIRNGNLWARVRVHPAFNQSGNWNRERAVRPRKRTGGKGTTQQKGASWDECGKATAVACVHVMSDVVALLEQNVRSQR